MAEPTTIPWEQPGPPDYGLEYQLEDWYALDQMYTDGKLAPYRGEFVFYANGTIFGHGRGLADPATKAKAAAAGIPPWRLVHYFVFGEKE